MIVGLRVLPMRHDQHRQRYARKLRGPRCHAAATAALLAWAAWPIASHAEDWPQWRGPHRNGTWTESGVLTLLPTTGLHVRWRSPVGLGWSSPVVYRTRVFVTDVRLEADICQERVHCFDEAQGKLLWTYAYDAVYPEWARIPDHRSPPTATPVAEEGRLYVLGANGHVHCLEPLLGELLWEKRLEREFEIKVLSCRASPLIEGNLLILFTGGKPGACLTALDKKSGNEVWRALDESVSNSSPIVVTAGGKRQLVVWTGESVTSLSPTTGEIYWQERMVTSNNDAIATPCCEGSMLLISGLMLELQSERPQATIVWPRSRAVARRVLSNTSTPLLRGDHLYSAKAEGELVCLHAPTGRQVWATDTVTGLKPGASIHLTAQGDAVWLFTDEGNLIRAHLTPQGYEELGRARLLEPTSPFSGKLFAWVPPVFANRHVFARNDQELVCAPLAADR